LNKKKMRLVIQLIGFALIASGLFKHYKKQMHINVLGKLIFDKVLKVIQGI